MDCYGQDLELSICYKEERREKNVHKLHFIAFRFYKTSMMAMTSQWLHGGLVKYVTKNPPLSDTTL